MQRVVRSGVARPWAQSAFLTALLDCALQDRAAQPYGRLFSLHLAEVLRKRQLLGLHGDLKKLSNRVSAGRLKNTDTVLESVGRYRERWPAASRFVDVEVQRDEAGQSTAGARHIRRHP